MIRVISTKFIWSQQNLNAHFSIVLKVEFNEKSLQLEIGARVTHHRNWVCFRTWK